MTETTEQEERAAPPANDALTVADSDDAKQTGASPEQAELDPLEAAQRECDELKENNLRALADLRNYQQRAQREKQEALKYAEGDFARELLVVLDDLERTLESAKTATHAGPVVEGVRIVHDHFLKVLRGRHIERIEALGKPFDPSFHEAMMRRPSDEHEAGTVLQEVAKGYQMHDRVLRHAKVIVSSGPEQASGRETQEREES